METQDIGFELVNNAPIGWHTTRTELVNNSKQALGGIPHLIMLSFCLPQKQGIKIENRQTSQIGCQKSVKLACSLGSFHLLMSRNAIWHSPNQF